MGKKTLLLAAGAGYLLGTRAGRERYDQIVAATKKLWGSAPVQQGVSKAGDVVKDQAPVVKDKVVDAAHKATDAVTPSHKGADAQPEVDGTYTQTPEGSNLGVDDDVAHTTASSDRDDLR